MSDPLNIKSSSSSSIYPVHSTELEACIAFLRSFIEDYNTGNVKYMQQLQDIANHKSRVLQIQLDDILSFSQGAENPSPQLYENVLKNTKRYLSFLYAAADECMPRPNVELKVDDHDPYDVFLQHRKQRLEAATQLQAGVGGANETVISQERMEQLFKEAFPPELVRRYEIQLIPGESNKTQRLRDVRAKDVGHFVSIRGIVTRVTDVAPQVRVVSYICAVCGYESYQPVNDKEFSPLAVCPSAVCQKNENSGKLSLQTRGSKFVRYQTIKLQELHTEVPVGHIPRSITLRVFGHLTRTMKPGDLVTVSGTYLVAPYHGYRAIRAGLTTDTYIEVTHVVPDKKNYTQTDFPPELLQQVEEKAQDPKIYDLLSASIAPEIYGHQDVKKALLLLLLGGVTRRLPDGMKIRGDINVLLMGDPGVAKSQLLKHIAHVAPRGIYTTGKGSSGVGLTAAVLRDPVSGDMSLEGGSLVLADNGICCIDEFDKMEESDRTAIHEVMEQQTVSIAKAGITTTLNARTAVLAAANPVLGRWKPKMSIENNLGLPAALLSRFDLLFILLDKPNVDTDSSLARHVTHVHMYNAHPQIQGIEELFSPQFLRAYISRAKQCEPFIPKDLTDYIVGNYVGLRKEGDEEGLLAASRSMDSRMNTRQRFCTARSLLSILRLAQAMARLHLRTVVDRDDVEEAIRLLSVSKTSHLEEEERTKYVNPIDRIFDLIRKMKDEKNSSRLSRKDVYERVVRSGNSADNLNKTLDAYSDLGLWVVTNDEIRFLNNDGEKSGDDDDNNNQNGNENAESDAMQDTN